MQGSIQAYLQGQQTAEATTKYFDQILRSSDNAEDAFSSLWLNIIAQVKQGSALKDLVQLVKAIKDLPGSPKGEIWGQRFTYAELPLLGMYMRDEWNCKMVLVAYMAQHSCFVQTWIHLIHNRTGTLPNNRCRSNEQPGCF